MKRLILIALWVISVSSINSAVINVPVDQPTIQDGIDAAVDGDIVLVAPGTYNENIIFNGKNIILISSYGAEVTFLQPANSSENTVRIINGESSEAKLAGFTIQNSSYRRALLIWNSSPEIKNNIFYLNRYGETGGVPI